MTKSWKTKLIHSDAHLPEGFRSLVTPVYRGSTLLFPSAESVNDEWNQYEAGYTYGLHGTPTTLELGARICELEGGYRTIITPSGQSALALINLTFLKKGDHVVIPESLYEPHRALATHLLSCYGVEWSAYEPRIGRNIEKLLRTNTRLVWCESPGSITMEVQDVPEIANVAHQHGALLVLDNTWSAGVLFDAFAHDVDITMQALTKYIGGHSDLLLGSVTVRDNALYQQLGATHKLLGLSASPDDCSLALRGMQTLAVRLKHIESSALNIARWLAQRSEIAYVLHPALDSCPGHDIWQRDFAGSAGVFSIVFNTDYSKKDVHAFVNDLELFEIGYSWAGVTSLALACDFSGIEQRPKYDHRIVRLNIGLEDTQELIADIDQALRSLS